jgi:hypothetical protein
MTVGAGRPPIPWCPHHSRAVSSNIIYSERLWARPFAVKCKPVTYNASNGSGAESSERTGRRRLQSSGEVYVNAQPHRSKTRYKATGAVGRTFSCTCLGLRERLQTGSWASELTHITPESRRRRCGVSFASTRRKLGGKVPLHSGR